MTAALHALAATWDTRATHMRAEATRNDLGTGRLAAMDRREAAVWERAARELRAAIGEGSVDG